MRPDREENPGPLTYKSGALFTALRGLAAVSEKKSFKIVDNRPTTASSSL